MLCFYCAYPPIKVRSLYITGSRVLRHVQYNKLIYAEDILVLNEANRDTSPIVSGVPRLYGIAKRAGRLCGECYHAVSAPPLLSFTCAVEVY
jgi:hypothetical protein